MSSRWLILLLIPLILFCTWKEILYNDLDGSGSLVVTSYNVGEFDKINLVNKVNDRVILRIVQGDKNALTIETDNNFSKLIRHTIENSALTLDLMLLAGTSPTKLVFTVTVKDLHVLNLFGKACIVESTPIKTDHFELVTKNTKNIRLDIDADTLSVESSYIPFPFFIHPSEVGDGGQITIAGKAKHQIININGGTYDASHLQSEFTEIDIDRLLLWGGAYTDYPPHVIIQTSKRLDAVVNGAGIVEYYGSPDISMSRVTGQGVLKQIGQGTPTAVSH